MLSHFESLCPSKITSLETSGSHSSQQQPNASETGTVKQDCGNFKNMMSSDDYGAGNINLSTLTQYTVRYFFLTCVVCDHPFTVNTFNLLLKLTLA